MKKILTALLITVLLASVNGCQTVPPDTKPAPQTPTVKTEPASESDWTTVYTTAALEQILAGINFKPTISTIKKSVTENENGSQSTSPHTKRESLQVPIFSIEDIDTKGTEPNEPPKAVDPTPAPKQPDTEPDATLTVTVKATPLRHQRLHQLLRPRQSHQHPHLYFPRQPRSQS